MTFLVQYVIRYQSSKIVDKTTVYAFRESLQMHLKNKNTSEKEILILNFLLNLSENFAGLMFYEKTNQRKTCIHVFKSNRVYKKCFVLQLMIILSLISYMSHNM